MLFWSTVALLTLAVLWTVLWPLLRSRGTRRDDEHDPLIAVYRDRRREIESERAAGRLSDTEAAAAQEELVAQMARELPDPSAERSTSTTRSSSVGARVIAVVLILLIPATSGLIYLQVGAPELTDPDTVAALTAPPRFDAAQVDQLIAQVEDRVKANPNDGEAWLVLASARKFRGDHATAIEAFERALRLNPPGARMLAEFAESLAILAQGSFAGRPLQLLEQAMSLDPDDAKAVALMGAAQFQIGNYSAARTLLGRLLAAIPADQGDQRAAMTEVIKRIDDRIAATTGLPPPAIGSAPPVTAGASTGAIQGRITLDPGLQGQATADATLFITARAVSGPRIPYAASRIDQPTWPVDFKLDDSQAMDPARRLSSATEVVIEARLSRSGNAARSAGDLYGTSAPIAPGAQGLQIVIDRVFNP